MTRPAVAVRPAVEADIPALLDIWNPQIRRSVESIDNRSINATVVVSPSTALATNALAIQVRSCGGRPRSSNLENVSSSIRTHSRA